MLRKRRRMSSKSIFIIFSTFLIFFCLVAVLDRSHWFSDRRQQPAYNLVDDEPIFQELLETNLLLHSSNHQYDKDPGSEETPPTADSPVHLLLPKATFRRTRLGLQHASHVGKISDADTSYVAPDIDTSGYLFYNSHSGFSNQVLSFQSALSLAHILNRTLIVPPVMLGARCTLDWRPFDLLSSVLQDIYQDFGTRDSIMKIQQQSTGIENLDPFIEYLFRKVDLMSDCREDTLENCRTIISVGSDAADLEDCANTIVGCFLRRNKFNTGSQKPLGSLYFKQLSNSTFCTGKYFDGNCFETSWQQLRRYHSDWELIPFSRFYNLTGLDAKMIDYFDFLKLVSTRNETLSTVQLRDANRYHYQLWDDKTRDLAWRKKLLAPEDAALIENTSSPKTKRKLFYKASIPRSAWRYHLLRDDVKGSAMEHRMIDYRFVESIKEAGFISRDGGLFLTNMTTCKDIQEDCDAMPLHRQGHYLAAIDVAHNISPFLKAHTDSGLSVFHIGSMFGTARLRIRDSKFRPFLRTASQRLSVIVDPHLNYRADRFLAHALCDTNKKKFVSLHLRGGEGGGFSGRVPEVLALAMAYFKTQIKTACLEANIPTSDDDCKDYILYVATDIPSFKSTKFCQILSDTFKQVLSLDDVNAFEASYPDPHTSNEVYDIVPLWERSSRNLPACKSLFDPFLDQILASRAWKFYGTPGSTFSALIHKAIKFG